MLPQGVLGFQYEADRSSGGLTSLAGLPLYLDLVEAIGLGAAIRQNVRVAGTQGWLDIQMAGADLPEPGWRRLRGEPGAAGGGQRLRGNLALDRAGRVIATERRSLKTRWRRLRERTVQSHPAGEGVRYR
jgi:hypothetical protein